MAGTPRLSATDGQSTRRLSSPMYERAMAQSELTSCDPCVMTPLIGVGIVTVPANGDPLTVPSRGRDGGRNDMVWSPSLATGLEPPRRLHTVAVPAVHEHTGMYPSRNSMMQSPPFGGVYVEIESLMRGTFCSEGRPSFVFFGEQSIVEVEGLEIV